MTMRNNNGNSAIPDVHNTRPSLACGQQPESGRPRHECGVCGIFGHEDAAKLTYFGLYALQHRGQESAGIVTSDGKKVSIHKAMGLVPEILPNPSFRVCQDTWQLVMSATPPPVPPISPIPNP